VSADLSGLLSVQSVLERLQVAIRCQPHPDPPPLKHACLPAAAMQGSELISVYICVSGGRHAQHHPPPQSHLRNPPASPAIGV